MSLPRIPAPQRRRLTRAARCIPHAGPRDGRDLQRRRLHQGRLHARDQEGRLHVPLRCVACTARSFPPDPRLARIVTARVVAPSGTWGLVPRRMCAVGVGAPPRAALPEPGARDRRARHAASTFAPLPDAPSAPKCPLTRTFWCGCFVVPPPCRPRRPRAALRAAHGLLLQGPRLQDARAPVCEAQVEYVPTRRATPWPA